MTITVKTSEKTKEMMQEYYEDLKKDKTPPYAVFQAIDGDTVVTLYESGKCVFQGKDADLASEYWVETERINSGYVQVTNSDDKKKQEIDKPKTSKYMYVNSIGSDEVGTGDYFGPIVVTASYVKRDDVPYLKELGCTDSKKLTDEKILEIAPLVAKKIKYTSLILSNSDYNKYHSQYNMNKVKAILHNKVLLKIMEEKPDIDYIIVDQFAEPFVYYNYLKDTPNIQRNITFMTKAESLNMAVACSSIICRYLFLKEYDKLNKKLNIKLPKGAGSNVDEIGKQLVKKYGKDILENIAKLSFKNTEKILTSDNQ
ncbi:MAG: ribonuclease HIII [Bacilli bacterium]|nr:ribonuclease HIII [Bacilli bacterium]